MNGDEDDIDAAKMERQIVYVVIAEGGKSCDLDDLIQNEKPCEDKTDIFSLFRACFFIKITTETAKEHENKKPGKMKNVKMRKSDALYDGAGAFEKVLKHDMIPLF